MKKALKSLKSLARTKQPTAKQIERARNAKAIKIVPKLRENLQRKIEADLGTISKNDIAGAVKGFRQTYKKDFGLILKNPTTGDVIARTRYTSGKTTLAESFALKMLSKYGKSFDSVQVIAVIPKAKPEEYTVTGYDEQGNPIKRKSGGAKLGVIRKARAKKKASKASKKNPEIRKSP